MNLERPGNLPNPERDVAIVGYSYRMPGGIKCDADFWRLLSERQTVKDPVVDRYGRGYRPIGPFSGPSRFASAYEGLIHDDQEWLFDPGLFGISHNEMLSTNPQVRMLLNCAWETFERAGWDLHSLRNSPTGVFIGAQTPAAASWRPVHGVNEFSVPNSSLAMLANRVSYHFNLMGSSLTCCTACSAGLSALHTALHALRYGDCQQALVGSVNYLGASRLSAGFNALGVISPDGQSNSFDAEANGYMRAEGAFLFALKPLEAAERDGDHIHAVVEATAINTAGGADGTGELVPGRSITAPTQHSQVELMRTACIHAGRHPGDFDYIEAHATGTVVGDRIEGNAIAEAYGGLDRSNPLRVSSVKSNVGHMEAAAFHCSLLKVVLMMQERTFAPTSGNYLVPNPEIDFDRCPMQVQTVCEPFPDRPAVVGINSFGFGGANGHCVVREYQPNRPRIWSTALAPNAGFLVPLSARTTEALQRSAKELRDAVDGQDLDLHTVAANLGRRRTHFNTRAAFAGYSREDLLQALDIFAEEASPVSTVAGGERSLAMVFSGQGTQWAGCGRTLYDAHPVFRRTVDAIEEHWSEYADFSLRNACFSATQTELDECQLAQPAIFMLQCALVELFKTWGVYPDCVVGHSSGEVAAAYACGALSLVDATRLVYHRATLQQRQAGSGRMLAIGMDRAGVEQLLAPLNADQENCLRPVEIACENAPASTVVCGPEDSLQPVMAELDRRNLRHSLLPGNIAFHSSAMDSLGDDMLSSLAFMDQLPFDADAPFISSVTGLETERLDSAYWWSNTRQPVNFAAAMATVKRDFRPDIVLEIAPHGALQTMIIQCLEDLTPRPACVPTLMRDTDSCLGFHEALGALFRAGLSLDFATQYPCPQPIAHLLPGHPREEQAALDALIDDEHFRRQGEYSHGPLVGHRMAAEDLRFEARLSEKDFPWLTEHRVHHASIMPAAGYMELLLEAFEGVPLCIDEIEFLQPCPVPSTPVRLQTSLEPVPHLPGAFTFVISSRPFDTDEGGERHCLGRLHLLEGGGGTSVSAPRRLEEIDRSRFAVADRLDSDLFYERLEAVLEDAFQYGPNFRTIQNFDFDKVTKAMLVELEMDAELWVSGRDEGYVLCPPLLDGGLQIFLYYLMYVSDVFSIPKRARNVTFLRPPSSPRVTCYVTKSEDDWTTLDENGQFTVPLGERSIGCISFYDSDTGELIACMDEYYSFSSNPRWADLPNSRHVVSWQPKNLPDVEMLLANLPNGDIEPGKLISILEDADGGARRACHIVEFAGSREPGETVIQRALSSMSDTGGQSEFWLLSDSNEASRACYDALHQHDAALRFASLEFNEGGETAFDKGLLRPEAADLVILHDDVQVLGTDGWSVLRRLTVDGGLVLITHAPGAAVQTGAGWTIMRAGQCSTLLQAPLARNQATAAGLPGPRWALGEKRSLATDWVSRLERPDVHAIAPETLSERNFLDLEEWPGAADVQAIDFFCGRDPDDPTGEAITSRFVAFVQALVPCRIRQANSVCRLTVVTEGAACQVEDPRGQALWGAVRSMALEVGEEARLEFCLVDLGSPEDLDTLVRIGGSNLRERELAVRERRMWVPRVLSQRERFSPLPSGTDAAYRLCLENPGQVNGLQMRTYIPPVLAADDVEIEVTAAALNFRDVMVTLGLLPALAYERSALGKEVGMEASGVIRCVGDSVRNLQVGDAVAFTKGGCIANRVVVSQNSVFGKPERLGMIDAAASLSVYVTAYYALVHLARLRAGQRVLIHSAMGGVGQAAIALAQDIGAEIYTTAGSKKKREQLLAMGAEAALDSHSYDWFEDLMAATGGEGVDVVLNSLAGHHIVLCLQALRPGGWHCEIGKVDIYADNALSLAVFRKNLRFAAIDVDRLMLDDPDLSGDISQTCMDMLGRAALPPLPATVFPCGQYAEALRLMMAGQHQGKLVLEVPATDDPGFPIADSRPFLDPDATYLVTGGLGGMGLCLLPYLVTAGARHLTLMDMDPDRKRDTAWVRRSSALDAMDEPVEIDIVAGDVSREADVRRCIDELQRPLKGVFHLAGKLDDRLLSDLTPRSHAKVFAPKAQGGFHLHQATLDCPLDHFVLFSSTAATFGNPGQINYSAASAYLDGLAAWRRRQGLPGLAYNMSAVAEVGMAARQPHVLRMIKETGMPAVSSRFAIANLDYALRTGADRDHLVTAVFKRPPWSGDTADYMRIGRLMNNQDAFRIDAGTQLTIDSVVEQIASKVAELCGHEEGSVDEPLSSFGLNSISVAELGSFILTQFNYQTSALELMTTASCQSLAQAIMGSALEEDDEDQAESSGAESEEAAPVRRSVRRPPSTFASKPSDHFPSEALSGEQPPAPLESPAEGQPRPAPVHAAGSFSPEEA